MKKTLVTLIIIAIALTASITTVQAASFAVKLTPSTTQVQKGSTVKVVVAVNNLNFEERGLTALYGILDYDKTVFNELTVTEDYIANEINGVNGWDRPTLNPNSNKMLTSKGGYQKTDADILEIALTVKETAKVGTTTITLKDIKGSDNESDIAAVNTSCTIQITEKTAGDNNPSGTVKPKITVSKENVANGVKFTLTSDKQLKAVQGWELSSDKKTLTRVYTSTVNETIILEDLDGNKSDSILIEAKIETPNNGNNDQVVTIKPKITVKKENVANGVKVTLTSDKELSTMPDWQLSTDKKTLTRVYTKDFSGTIVVKDRNGIESDPIQLDVKLEAVVDKTVPTASVKYKKSTNGAIVNVTVTVTASEEIKPIDKWTLSADKKTLTRVFAANATETIVLEDLAGNKSQPIKIQVDTSLPNGGTDQENAGANGNQGSGQGNSTSEGTLPKTGFAYMMPAITIIAIIGAGAFIRYKSMEY